MLVATAPTAMSIVISIQVPTELGKMQLKCARLILGAEIVDDILSISVLSVVTTMVRTGTMTSGITNIIFLVLKILGFCVLLVGAVVLVAQLLHVENLWKSKGSVEGI